MAVILTGVQCSLILAQNCMALIVANVEHFICCAIYISSFENVCSDCLPTFSGNIWALVELFEFFVYLGFICQMNSLQCFFLTLNS